MKIKRGDGQTANIPVWLWAIAKMKQLRKYNLDILAFAVAFAFLAVAMIIFFL